jgi:hypothetical protein
MASKKKIAKHEKRLRWTPEEIKLLQSTGTALAKKLHRSPASVGIKFYNLTSAGRIKYFAKGKKAKIKPAKKTTKPVAKRTTVKKLKFLDQSNVPDEATTEVAAP